MTKPFILYGWHLSYFAGKARCYLQYKNIPFIDQPVNMPTLLWRIKRKTGAVVMPVLVTPEGVWIQDTSDIIDRMEARFPQSSVNPPTPVQRFASYLMEAWGDEWWIPIAMHTRWNYPENYALFEQEAGDALLPGLPRFLKRRAVARIANTLRGMMPSVGIKPAQYAAMDQWTLQMLDLLDQHFAVSPFLFGDRPALGDFGLVGTMYGHLGRDPWPRRELIAPRPHLRAWIDRMAHLKPQDHARFLANDAIAPTLEPVFRHIFAEFIPMLEGINREVRAKLPSLPAGRALPRALAEVEFPMGTMRFRRAALPYTLWMAQRTLDTFHAMPAKDQQEIRTWLTSLGGEGLLALDIPRLRRVGLRVAPEYKSVVITGASAGIGKALALEFASRGYPLGLMARRREALEDVRAQILAANPGRALRVEIAVLDVNQDDAVADAMNTLFARMGSVGTVVVNAGINDFTRVGKGQFEKEKRLIQTNLVGAIATVNAAAAYFIAQGRGRIVGISSLAALNGMPTQAAYCATKAGFSAYLDAARIELARHGIGVTTILPGFVNTEIVANIDKYPFVVSAEQAAREIVNAIETGQSQAAIPAWPWKWLRPFMRLMPDAAWKMLK